MRHRFHQRNPDDLEDALQVGYIRLWQQLEQQPTHFKDKSDAYIALNVCFSSYPERHQNQNYYNSLNYDADVAFRALSQSRSKQVDLSIDLEKAIHDTAIAVADHMSLLLALYYVVTSVQAKELAQLYQIPTRTFDRRTKTIRMMLQEQLSNYR